MGRNLTMRTTNKKADRHKHGFTSFLLPQPPLSLHILTRNMEDEYLFEYRYSGEMQHGVRHRWLISLPILRGEPYLSPIFYLGRHLVRMEMRQMVP